MYVKYNVWVHDLNSAALQPIYYCMVYMLQRGGKVSDGGGEVNPSRCMGLMQGDLAK